ncbi:uncharacterized protein TNCV_2384861 [Trichonephila clavipes]|nr:uncharacterized protein TNCV_2384861 [Trichonephila clavipes]
MRKKKVPESLEELPSGLFPPERHIQITSENLIDFTFKRIKYGPDKEPTFKEITISREQWAEMIEKYGTIENAAIDNMFQCRALDWFEVLGYRFIEDKTTDYAHLKRALSEQFPVVRNRSELETRFYSSSQRRDQQPSDFIYELLKIHKILKLEMSEEKLIDHVISRLEPQILDYVEVRHPRNTANLLQIVDKYEERFMHRQIRGSVRDLEVQALMKTIVLIPGIDRKIEGKQK